MPKFRLSSLRFPIIAAPMAGGCNTPAWVAGVGRQGGLGSFGFAYSKCDKIHNDITIARQLAPGCPVNANFFVFPHISSSPPIDHKLALETLNRLPHSEPIDLPTSPYFYDLEEQVQMVWELRPEVITFHFGIPHDDILRRAHDLDITIGITATCVEEALKIKEAGADFIIVQGTEAGGHRGCFNITGTPPNSISTMDLLQQCASHKHLQHIPLVAAGGLMRGEDISRALQEGAAAVQIGTLFLPTTESGIHRTYKEYLLNRKGRDTVLTRGFSGRWARAIGNEFTDHMHGKTVLPFPMQNTATQSIRKLAQENNDGEYMSLYAGSLYKDCRSIQSVEDVFQSLVNELK